MSFEEWLNSQAFEELLMIYKGAYHPEIISVRKQELKQWLLEKHKEVMGYII